MEEWRGSTEEERAYYALSHRVYSRFAPFYDVVVRPIEGLRREVARLSGAGPGTKILDVATGTGAQARAFAATGAVVVGADLSHEMLRVARRKNPWPNLSFVHADAKKLPFPDESFDIAGVSFALHEMPFSICESVLGEMRRVVTPNGRLLIVDYTLPPNTAWGALLYHAIKLYEADQYARFVRSDLRGLLASRGVAVREERSALLGMVKILCCELQAPSPPLRPRGNPVAPGVDAR